MVLLGGLLDLFQKDLLLLAPDMKILSLKKYLPFSFTVFIVLILAIQCKKGCTDPNAANYDPDAKKDNGSCYYISLPSNLQYTISNTANSGLVEVEASAMNENFFTVLFFENNDSIIVTTTDGNAAHSFSDSGTYIIKIRAHLTYSEYIEVVDSVEISINSGGVSNAGYSTPMSYPNYSLVWNDEFNGTSLSSDWIYEIGNGSWGWGNNELEYYRSENTSVANGYLTITAKQQFFNGYDYTSSRIKTQGNKNYKYGRIDIRAKLPYGQGIWPALWMLGENITSVSWPSCGEIDIMELIGGGSYNDRTVHGTLHWNDNGHASYGGHNSLASGAYADEFHVFTIVWSQSSITWYRDDIQYHVVDITNLSAFHDDFFFIFNLAVGGNWPGSPDASTVFPQKMIVDYIRVFQ